MWYNNRKNNSDKSYFLELLPSITVFTTIVWTKGIISVWQMGKLSPQIQVQIVNDETRSFLFQNPSFLVYLAIPPYEATSEICTNYYLCVATNQCNNMDSSRKCQVGYVPWLLNLLHKWRLNTIQSLFEKTLRHLGNIQEVFRYFIKKVMI